MSVFQKRKLTSGEKALTEPQFKRLMDYITDFEEKVLIEVAVYVGIRRSDVVALEVKNINLEKQTLTFFEKKKDRIRTIPIPQHLAADFQMLIKVNKTKKSKYLFPGRFNNSEHLSSKTAYNILHKNLKKAGLPLKPFHALRATCIKLYQKKGWSVEQTAKLIGDTVAVVQQHYATPSDEELAEVMAEKPIT